ncbi:hypothetical protein BH09GEM1_BH09GEM1_07300 [soil metagenome]
MTPDEIHYVAGICRRVAVRCVDPWYHPLLTILTARQIEQVHMQAESGRCFEEAADLLDAVADEPEPEARIRTVAEMHLCSTHEERAAAWAWVVLMLRLPRADGAGLADEWALTVRRVP